MPPRVLPLRWPASRVLAAARERTQSIKSMDGWTSKQVQDMLELLMKESGWNEQDFMDELIKDVQSRNRH